MYIYKWDIDIGEYVCPLAKFLKSDNWWMYVPSCSFSSLSSASSLFTTLCTGDHLNKSEWVPYGKNRMLTWNWSRYMQGVTAATRPPGLAPHTSSARNVRDESPMEAHHLHCRVFRLLISPALFDIQIFHFIKYYTIYNFALQDWRTQHSPCLPLGYRGTSQIASWKHQLDIYGVIWRPKTHGPMATFEEATSTRPSYCHLASPTRRVECFSIIFVGYTLYRIMKIITHMYRYTIYKAKNDKNMRWN